MTGWMQSELYLLEEGGVGTNSEIMVDALLYYSVKNESGGNQLDIISNKLISACLQASY